MKKFIICLLFIILLSINVNGFYDDTLSRVVDNADLLSDYEESNLQSRIDSIIDTYEFDVVILTTESCDGKTVVEYADDFYDYTGYGYGDNYDGILFLLSMEERDWYFSTCGYGITVFTDYGIEYIGNSIVSYLSSGDYYTAFDRFLDYSEEFIIQANTDIPFDIDNKYKYEYEYEYDDSFDYGRYVVRDNFLNVYYRMVEYFWAVLLIIVIIAFAIVMGMRGKMKMIRSQPDANLYIKKDSLDLKRQMDMFLYSNVTKRLKETNNSSRGGGSSTHTSSSGRSHGGGGGKF